MDAIEAKKVMSKLHEGIYAIHANGHMMACQALRKGYYWLIMKRDCIEYFWKCHKYQIYEDKINIPLASLFNIVGP